MIDKNMMRIILILAICFLVGCASNENVVSVRQVKSDEPIVLRMRKDRTFIHSLLYPVAFEFKKNDSRDIYYAENSYWPKIKTCPLVQPDVFYGKKTMMSICLMRIRGLTGR